MPGHSRRIETLLIITIVVMLCGAVFAFYYASNVTVSRAAVQSPIHSGVR
jgi:hypothetical protein